jgi:hypothetical protein
MNAPVLLMSVIGLLVVVFVAAALVVRFVAWRDDLRWQRARDEGRGRGGS